MSNDILPLNQEKIDQIFKELNNQNNTLLNFDPCDCLWDNNDANRSTGRTTRLADYYIQELFNNPNKEIEIIDHTNDQQSNIHLTQRILHRIFDEFRGVKIKVVKQNTLKYVR